MKVEITCDGTDYVDYKTLKPFQGDLKTLSNENLEKLKNSIIKYGYSVPAFVWQSGEDKYISNSIAPTNKNIYNKDMVDTILCRKCKQAKTRDLFVKNQMTKDGKKGLCKKCKAESDKEYRRTHKKEQAEYFHKLWFSNEERRKQNKKTKEIQTTGLYATEYVKNKVCERCGMTDKEHHEKYNERLHIHHIDNNGMHNIRRGIKPIHKNLMVVCRSCHVSLDNKNRDYTGRGYKIWETRRKNIAEKHVTEQL